MAMIICSCLKEERKILSSAQLSNQVTVLEHTAVVSTLFYCLGQREWKKTERRNRLSSLPSNMFLRDERVNTDTCQLDSVPCLCCMKHLEGKWPGSSCTLVI